MTTHENDRSGARSNGATPGAPGGGTVPERILRPHRAGKAPRRRRMSQADVEETLAELHRQGRVERLQERRNGHAVYVAPEYVDGRPIDSRPGTETP